MPRTGSTHDFENFDDWESFSLEDDIYIGAESDLVDDWEDDGAIAEVREPAPVVISQMEDDSMEETLQLDEESAEVFSLLERAQSKRANELLELAGPSEDELQKIEGMGIDDYIDVVLAEDSEIEESEAEEEPQLLHRSLEVESDEGVRDPEFSFEDEIIIDEEVTELVVQPLFEGVAVSLPTLFDEEGEVEYKTTARLAKRLTDENVAAVFLATLDGEGNTLSRKERKNLVRNVSKVTESPVVVDVSAPSIRQSVQIADDCSEAGASGFVVSLNASIRDPYALCEALHENHRESALFVKLEGNANELPISPEFLYDLPINGVIDATGDIAFFMHLIGAYSGPVYIGTTSMIATGHLMGATGVVLAAATVSNDLVESAFSGDREAQAELSAWERETGTYGTTMSRSIKIALESEFLVSSTMRD